MSEPETKVKAVHPKAFACDYNGSEIPKGHRYIVITGHGRDGKLIGTGATEAEAWADADWRMTNGVAVVFNDPEPEDTYP